MRRPKEYNAPITFFVALIIIVIILIAVIDIIVGIVISVIGIIIVIDIIILRGGRRRRMHPLLSLLADHLRAGRKIGQDQVFLI